MPDLDVNAAPRDEIGAVLDELMAAWQAGDADRFARPFAARARFVAFDGAILTGPEEIAAFHRQPFKTHLAGTKLVVKVTETRPLADSAILVFSRGGIIKDGDVSGDLIGESAQTFVYVRRDGRLVIEMFQNTRVRPIDGPAAAEIWKQFDRAWAKKGP